MTCKGSWQTGRERFAIAAFVVVASTIGARGAEPILERVDPVGVQRGGQVRVSLSGRRLGPAPCELLCERPGLKVRRLRHRDEQRIEVELTVAADAPLGAHPLRLRTPYGLSNLLTLQIGALPHVAEREPNNERAAAQPIAIDSTVRGVVLPEDVDCFAVDLAKGERLSVEIEAMRLGRSLLDPAIALIDPHGVRLVASDDDALTRHDGFASLRAPASGTYLVEVREAALRGGPDADYLLHVGRFPRPVAVFPPGGREGETMDVRFLEDDGRTVLRRITLPAEGSPEYVSAGRDDDVSPIYMDEVGRICPTPVFVRSTPFGNQLEAEPNDEVGAATRCEIPIGCCGVVESPGDVDLFRFTARRGAPLDVRVVARALGSPLDALLRIRTASGKNLAGNDDERGRPDSYLRFEPPTDGEYLIEVSDHLGRGGARFFYRVEATAAHSRVDATVAESRRFVAEVVEVPRGGRTAALVRLNRRDATSPLTQGPLTVQISDLPAGVTASTPLVAEDFDRAPVLFRASPDAPLAASFASVTVKAASAADGPFALRPPGADWTSRFRHQTWLVRGANNAPVWSYFGQRLPVAATLPTPFSVHVRAPRTALARNGSLGLDVSVERQPGFQAPIVVALLYNPPGVASAPSKTIPRGENTTTIPLTASSEAALHTWDMLAVGRANSNGRRVAASEFFSLRVGEPYVVAQLPSIAAVPGSTASYRAILDVRRPFEGKGRLELIGLPLGATTIAQEVDAKSTEAVFPVSIAADAQPGRVASLSCRLALTDHGETIECHLGEGTLQIDAP